jgi:phage-related protein
MEEVQRQVNELLGWVTSDIMRPVYEHWIERLNQVVHTDGDYV